VRLRCPWLELDYCAWLTVSESSTALQQVILFDNNGVNCVKNGTNLSEAAGGIMIIE